MIVELLNFLLVYNLNMLEEYFFIYNDLNFSTTVLKIHLCCVSCNFCNGLLKIE